MQVSATPLSTIIRDYATAAAIIGGGLWALWRWVFEERLRRHREFPALDGELKTVETRLDHLNVILTVNALWRNRGKLPVEIDTTKTSVGVYSLDKSQPLGPFNPQIKALSYRAFPLADCAGYILEPGTDSTIQQCIVLPTNQMFVIHWAICIAASQKAYPYLKAEMWCVRDYVWRSGEMENTASQEG